MRQDMRFFHLLCYLNPLPTIVHQCIRNPTSLKRLGWDLILCLKLANLSNFDATCASSNLLIPASKSPLHSCSSILVYCSFIPVRRLISSTNACGSTPEAAGPTALSSGTHASRPLQGLNTNKTETTTH